jgi:hypothetical protein
MDVKIRAKISGNKEKNLTKNHFWEQGRERQTEEMQSEPWKERLCTSLDATSGSSLHML